MNTARLFFAVVIVSILSIICTADMKKDSPVKFPEKGALPSKYPPDDNKSRNGRSPEKGYYIFNTPNRTLEQVKKIQKEMIPGKFTAPKNDWKNLARTKKVLTEGGDLHIVAIGDSIVNDTMRSAWIACLREAYPKAKIKATVYVRGGGGCHHYREEDRINKNVVPLKPDLVFLGGISQKDIESIQVVIKKIRQKLPNAEFLLATGTFGTADPRDEKALARARHSGTGKYGKDLCKLAADEKCAYLDMTTPWAEYIRSTGKHPHVFYRDVVHANCFGEQILCRIMMAFFRP